MTVLSKITCRKCGKRFEGDRRRKYCNSCREPQKPVTTDVPAPAQDETAKESGPRKLSLNMAYEIGTPLEQSLALRTHLVELMGDASPRDAAALSRQIRDVSAEIVTLEAKEREEAEDAANTPDEAWDEEAI